LDGTHWGQKSGENASWKIQMEGYAVIRPIGAITYQTGVLVP
jgi:hypothetical protein